MLPAWQSNGLLPPGRHSCSLQDVRDRFVDNAPNPIARRRLFQALVLYILRVESILPGSTYWIDGGFVQNKPAPPADVDVVIHPGSWADVSNLDDDDFAILASLVTIQGVMTSELGYVARLQPFGGMLDGFLCAPGPVNEAYWDDTWSNVKEPGTKVIIPGLKKGYVEVTL